VARSALVAVVLLGFVATSARAQDDVEEEARQLFMDGAERFSAEEYAGALESFTASYALRQVPIVLFNMAQTLRLLGRDAQALLAYERYLLEETDLDPERAAAIDETMNELRARLAGVRLLVTMPGVEVRVGTRLLGTSPFPDVLWVEPGRQTFTATREGYRDATRTTTLRAGSEHDVRLGMEEIPPEGTIVVEANVDTATVEIDGRDYGRVPVEAQLSPGEYEVEVDASGYRGWDRDVTLGDEQRLELLAELEVRDPIAGKWWFWAALGGAVAVGLAIVLGVTLKPEPPQPLEGDIVDTVQALRW